jgi:RNA polymerase subunit RPABC4/transcription elongation factor Spt4
MLTKTFTYYRETEEGDDEITVELPASWRVCPDCNGQGTTYLGWAAKDQPAFSREDLDEEGPEFLEEYMTGVYDRTCPGCKGRTTVLEIDHDVCENHGDQEIREAYAAMIESEKEDAEFRAMCASERRMGA